MMIASGFNQEARVLFSPNMLVYSQEGKSRPPAARVESAAALQLPHRRARRAGRGNAHAHRGEPGGTSVAGPTSVTAAPILVSA
jgi:hypothetical protein